jgi:hypothetical protein
MRILTAALVISLGYLAPAFGDTADRSADTARARALELALAWVAHHTGYAALATAPPYVVLAPDAMTTQAARLYSPPPREIFALFSCAERTLYLRNDADLDNPLVFSFLVREVVRYAQCEQRMGDYEAAAGRQCDLAREPYWAQAKFIRATPGLFASQGTPMTTAQADYLDRVALDVDKLADRACTAVAHQP